MDGRRTGAWSFDASFVNPDDLPKHYIYKTRAIANFLEVTSGNHERSLFLVGTKGSGKTLLLRYKAYLYWKKMNPEDITPYQGTGNNELIHSLDFEIRTLDDGTLKKLCDYKQWIRIWKFSILLLILRKNNVELVGALSKLKEFPEHYTLSEIVAKVLNDSKKYIFKDFLTITNDLNALVRTINNQSILFIDRLDQALSNIVKAEEYEGMKDLEEEDMRILIWKHAQYGFLEAAYNLNTGTSSHVKIFASARIEAMNVSSPQRQNVEGYCTRLDYNDRDLKEIFIKNINNTPPRYLLGTKKGNEFYNFFGFETMPHLMAKTLEGERKIEHVFDFLLRHTFRRPREIVKLGARVYGENLKVAKLDSSERIERVRSVVNKEAYFQILPDYCHEFLPNFKSDYLEQFAKQVDVNVIKGEVIDKIKDKDMLNYLYRMGLIGKLRNNKQNFLPPALHIYDRDMNIAQSEYYFIHPAFDRKIQEYHNYKNFHNKYNIVGHNNDFIPSPRSSSDFMLENDLSYYLPKEITGQPKTFDQKFPNYNINTSLYSLYKQCFSKLENKKDDLSQGQESYFNNTFRFLSCIADNHFARIIEKKFDIILEEWKEILSEKMENYRFDNQFTAQINDLEKGKDKFCFRQKGRILVAGMYVFLDLSLPVIKNNITNFSFTYKPYGAIPETASRFLRTAFFLYGLSSTSLLLHEKKEEFLNFLSDFEKESLKEWWIFYKNHELFVNPNLRDEHIKFLQEKLEGNL